MTAIRLGTNKNASLYGKQPGTILSAKIVQSKYPQKNKEGESYLPHQLLVTIQGDSGVRVDGYYGGVYDNEDGTAGFGKGGHAFQFLTGLQASGVLFNDVEDLAGKRATFEVITQVTAKGKSEKLFPCGPAIGAAPNVPPAPPAPPAQPRGIDMAALRSLAPPLAPVAPAIDGAAIWTGVTDQEVRSVVEGAVKNGLPEAAVVPVLLQAGVCKTQAEGAAIYKHLGQAVA